MKQHIINTTDLMRRGAKNEMASTYRAAKVFFKVISFLAWSFLIKLNKKYKVDLREVNAHVANRTSGIYLQSLQIGPQCSTLCAQAR